MEQKDIDISVHGEQSHVDADDDKTLVIKTRFFLPSHVEAMMPGLMLTAAIAALAMHISAKLTYVTPYPASCL